MDAITISRVVLSVDSSAVHAKKTPTQFSPDLGEWRWRLDFSLAGSVSELTTNNVVPGPPIVNNLCLFCCAIKRTRKAAYETASASSSSAPSMFHTDASWPFAELSEVTPRVGLC